ncbi:hypothetical protein MMPV_002794 [Pyropia vietnamensis]
MVASRTSQPRPTPAPVAAFAAVLVGLPIRHTSVAASPRATGTVRPVRRSRLGRRQQRHSLAPPGVVALTMIAPPPEVWHLAPMVLAEQGAPAAAIAFEAFCAGPAAAAAALRRGGGGGGGSRRRSGPDGFVPTPPPEREGADEVVMHPGGLDGRRIGLVTGTTLGGSSAINVAQWSESVNGYLDDWFEAAAAAKLPRVTDPGGRGAPEPRRGVWFHQLNVDARGRRVDAAAAYMAHALREGPTSALRSAGVTPEVDLRVGEGFLARSLGMVVGTYDVVPLAVVNHTTLLNDPATLRRWQAGRGGLLGDAASAGLGRVTVGDGAYFPASCAPLAAPRQPKFSAGCLSNLISRGRLSLPAGAAAATDPAAPPRVETNLLGDRREVATLLSCMRTLRATLRGFRPGFGMIETVPGSDTPLTEALVRRTAMSVFHLTRSVVSRTRPTLHPPTKGVDNLWVVDASGVSTMPRSAGPMSSEYMLAEHAAEALIRQFRASRARESA